MTIADDAVTGAQSLVGAVGRGARGVVDYTLTDRQRAAVERLERLADFIVAELDRIYGDPDAEPALGAITALNQCRWSEGASDDREQDDEREPSLGSLGSNASADTANQERWASGTSDAEDEHDGREPDVDREEVCEDEGAQCDDEGHDSDSEPDTDCEGDAQAPCHASADPVRPWPPLGSTTWTVERPYG